jgi:CheY-like chemotaxis protein
MKPTCAAFVALEKQPVENQGVFLKGIVCDWKMPGWDGLKLLAELKKSPYKAVEAPRQGTSREARTRAFRTARVELVYRVCSKNRC